MWDHRQFILARLGGRRIEQIGTWADRIGAASGLFCLTSLAISPLLWALEKDSSISLWISFWTFLIAIWTISILVYSSSILNSIKPLPVQGVNWKRDGF